MAANFRPTASRNSSTFKPFGSGRRVPPKFGTTLYRVAGLVLAFVLFGTGAVRSQATHRSTLGVEVPLAGDSGADGLAAKAAIELALQGTSLRADFRDTARGGFANAHVDEGRDASSLSGAAAEIVAGFGGNPRASVVIGGLSAELAAVDSRAVRAGLPLIVLAPLPDGCAAAGSFDGARPRTGSISISGAASLEALAVSAVAQHRTLRVVGVDDDGSDLARSRAACERRVFVRAGISGTAHDARAFVAPGRLGTLLCAGTLALERRAARWTTHRGYDSNDVPKSCFWVRRTVHLNPRQAAPSALFSERFHEREGYLPPDIAYVAYDAAEAALRIALHRRDAPDGLTANLRPCADGSAEGAWFEIVPTQRALPSPFFVRDARCTKRGSREP